MYLLHSLVLNTTVDIILQDVDSHDFDAAITKFVGRSAGNLSPTFAAVMGSNPVHNFSVRQLKIALDAIGMSGYALKDTATSKLFEAFIAKMDDKGGLSATGHHKITISNGIIVPRTLNLTHGDSPDPLACQVIAQELGAAGGGSPISHTSGATLPTLPAGEHEGFTLGPVKYNGSTAIPQVQSVDIEFGLQVDAVRGDGNIHPVATYIMSKAPKITVKTHDLETARLIGGASQLGSAASGNLVVYARKISETIGRELDTTVEHISFTATDWHAHVVEGIGGSNGERPVPGVEFTMLHASTPLTINTATAIT